MERIPVAGPWITAKEIRYVTDAVTRCWYEWAGYYHSRFENALAQYVGVSHALALPSCTSAIHLALAALGIGPGDEVIVPDVTWIATAAPISYLGASPVFVDIDESTWCLSLDGLRRAITPRTKAVIVVDLYGNMPDWPALRAIAEPHGIALIEDAAEAFGSELHGKKAGRHGDIGVFSFHGSKTITTGEGGMFVTDRKDLYERAFFLHDHGRARGDRSFFHMEVAYKYKLSNMQAALGLAQVERAEEIVDRKRQIFSWYCDELGSDTRLRLNPEFPGLRNSYWMSTVLVDPRLELPKQTLIEKLATRGIDSRPFFYPLSTLPAYADDEFARRAKSENTVAQRISEFGINLPSALNLTRQQASYVANALREILDQCEHIPLRAAS
jgi:perosamine synthetase